MADYPLDDAAAAALWRLRHEPLEHIGALYDDGQKVAASNTVHSNSDGSVKGRLQVPPGSLRALFHNHPPGRNNRDMQRGVFSPEDKAKAAQLGVPSYISAGEEIRRYVAGDSMLGKPVLAQIPLEQIRRLYMVEALKK